MVRLSMIIDLTAALGASEAALGATEAGVRGYGGGAGGYRGNVQLVVSVVIRFLSSSSFPSSSNYSSSCRTSGPAPRRTRGR